MGQIRCLFAIRRIACGACLTILLCAAWLAGSPTAAVAASVKKQGHIPVGAGVQLEYTVNLPAATGRFPVAMVYDGYCEGTGALSCNDPYSARALLNAGFAVLGVSVPGTSCSTGAFEAFTAQEWSAGAAAIEWAARQPWSSGRVGMFGDSFPGITQVGVAGLRPAHLDAIAPWQVTTDIYRDVGLPGGITNTGFGAFWGAIDQPLNSYRSGIEQALASKNLTCIVALANDLVHETSTNVAIQGALHPFDDSFWTAREPGANASKIDVPVFGCETWQDDEVGSRGSAYLSKLKAKRTWVVASNGYHGMCELNSPRIIDELVAFFKRFVMGKHNGFVKHTPHIQIWHDTHVGSAKDNVPSWVTSFKSYSSIPVRPLALYFQSDHELSRTKPKGYAPPDRYLYPGPDLGTEDGVVIGQHNILWSVPELPGTSVAYTTPPLTGDTEFFGSGSANIWMSSSDTGTDLQITLTEVRPDGQEVYVARGWLRASNRALDPTRSTALAPYQTDTQADARPLVPNQPTYMRVQLWPFDYVFRKGSSIRLSIDAPTGLTGGWILSFDPVPAINSIYADSQHPSAIVLGHLKGGHAKAPVPTCNTLLNQPCRRNAVRVPAGTLAIR